MIPGARNFLGFRPKVEPAAAPAPSAPSAPSRKLRAPLSEAEKEAKRAFFRAVLTYGRGPDPKPAPKPKPPPAATTTTTATTKAGPSK